MAETYELELEEDKRQIFENEQKFLAWVNGEKEKWAWLGSAGSKFSSISRQLSQPLTRLSQNLAAIIEKPDDKNAKQNLAAEVERFQQALKTQKYLHTSSPLYKYVEHLSETDTALAGAVVVVATTDRTQPFGNDRLMLEGLAAFSSFQLGNSKAAADSSRRLLKSLVNKYNSSISELETESSEKLAFLDDQILKREGRVSASTKTLATLMGQFRKNLRQEQLELRTETKNEVDGLLSESKTKIGDFEDFYETKIALLEPIEYWKGKRFWHRVATVTFAAVFLCYVASLIGVVVSYSNSFEQGFEGFLKFWNDAQLGVLGFLAILIGLALVLARIFYRLFASQLHLWNDASERVTMTQTYLALAEKGHAKDEFLGALLTRLFAPASDGVVKDDFGSIGPLDALVTRLGGKP